MSTPMFMMTPTALMTMVVVAVITVLDFESVAVGWRHGQLARKQCLHCDGPKRSPVGCPRKQAASTRLHARRGLREGRQAPERRSSIKERERDKENYDDSKKLSQGKSRMNKGIPHKLVIKAVPASMASTAVPSIASNSARPHTSISALRLDATPLLLPSVSSPRMLLGLSLSTLLARSRAQR